MVLVIVRSSDAFFSEKTSTFPACEAPSLLTHDPIGTAGNCSLTVALRV